MRENATSAASDASDRLVTITRTIDASRDLVFRMWTEPHYLKRWFAPRRCQLEILAFNFRVGGAFRYRIREPNGDACLCAGVFEEIAAPERIVYSMFFCDEQGNFVEAKSIGVDSAWPDRTTVTVTLAEHREKTTMTLHQTVPESVAKRTGAYPSWIEMLERLCEELAATVEG